MEERVGHKERKFTLKCDDFVSASTAMASSLSSAFGVVSENALTILWIGNFRTPRHRWNKPRPGELLCMIKTTEVLHLQGYQELK